MKQQNGNISYGRIFQLKKNINYDTRYFHEVVYNQKGTKSLIFMLLVPYHKKQHDYKNME